MNNEQLMSVRQVADYLQLNQTTVYAWAQQGVLPGYKLGKAWRFRPAEIEAWLEEQRPTPLDSLEPTTQEDD